jgi:hypothetical protein
VRRVSHLALVVLATAAAGCAVWALMTVVQRAGLPYQLDYEEGNILNAAVRLTRGLSPYPNPHLLPSVINPYGPVLYLIEAALVKVFGVTFFPGRILVILSGIAVAALIAFILQRETKSLAVAIAFGALFLCSPFVQFWWPLLRVDLVGLALTLAGLAVFHRNPCRAWTTAAFFLAAIYTKHTLLAAPAACFVWALFNQQRKAATRLLIAGVTIGAITLIIGEITTHGVLAFALFRTHPDPYRWSEYPSALRQVADATPLFVLLAVILFIGDVRQKKLSLPILYLLFSALAVLTIGKAGSNSNHLLELIAALCVAAGASFNYLVEFEGIRQLIPAVVVLLIASQTVNGSRALAFVPRESAGEQVISLIRRQPGPYILSENTGAVVLAGKTPLISNPFVYTQLVKYGGWSDNQLVNLLDTRRVPLVLIDQSRRQQWSKAFMDTLHENYRLSGLYDCRSAGLAFVPKDR